MIRLLFLLVALFVPSSAWAAACSGTAYAHAAGNFSNTTAVWGTTSTSGAPTFCTLTAGNAVVFDANTGAGSYTIDESISISSLTSVNTPAGVYLLHPGNTLTINNSTTNTTFDISHLNYCNANPCTTAVSSSRAISFTNTGGTVSITTGASLTAPFNQFGVVTFNGSGGTFELLDNAIFNGTNTFTAGTLSAVVNNSSPTFNGTFSVPAVGIWNCGTGTWNFTMNTNAAAMAVILGATVSCATGTLSFISASSTQTLTSRGAQLPTGLSIGTINISGLNVGGPTTFSLTLPSAGTLTLGHLNFPNLSAEMQVILSNNATITLSNAPTWVGATGHPITFYLGPTNATGFTFALPSSTPISPSWTAWCDIKFTGSSSPVSPINSYDICGNNNFNGGAVTIPVGGGGIIGG